MNDLATLVSGALGALCLLVVCTVYWRQQRLRIGGALLALCGLALLGLASRPLGAEDRAVPDLAACLDVIGEALPRLEAQVARLVQQQADLVAMLEASNTAPGDANLPEQGAIPEQGTSATQHVDEPALTLEIEVLGGVSDEELATIITWIQEVRADHRSSTIYVEPVMPLDSADPGGQRRRLMDEAGRVIDQVFAALNQRIDIVGLVSEPVPGPRLRLGLSDV
jgi:hypothetical protein